MKALAEELREAGYRIWKPADENAGTAENREVFAVGDTDIRITRRVKGWYGPNTSVCWYCDGVEVKTPAQLREKLDELISDD